MAKRFIRWTDYEDDFERIAENLRMNYGDQIEDEKTFNEAYSRYMEGENRIILSLEFRKQAWQHYAFKLAGGRDLHKDRQRNAQQIVKSQEEYEQLSARNVDLKGLDTKRKTASVKSPTERKRGIARPRRVTWKADLSELKKQTITVKGNRVVVYRNRSGKFVRVTKE
jgi:hypothetical protein